MKNIILLTIGLAVMQAQDAKPQPSAQPEKLLTAELEQLNFLYQEKEKTEEKIRRIQSEACELRKIPLDRCRITAAGVIRLPDPPAPAAAKEAPKK